MNQKEVNTAEKEASEVLHSLLSIEKVENPLEDNTAQQVAHIKVDKSEIVWQSNNQQQMYTTLENNYNSSNEVVVWHDPLDLDMNDIDGENEILVEDNEVVPPQQKEKGESKSQKKRVRKKYNRFSIFDERTIEIENNVHDVRSRFELGCECNDDSCFKGLNPETVYKHRLNIAELTKEEHDMYLMGVTMACLTDPGVTFKRKERRRLRTQYVYQGRRVCLSAFLYLENCTLYHLKRIRKHVMTQGVTPRVHGNHGKKPHNVFSLDIYRRATSFLKSYIQEKTSSSSDNLKSPLLLPADISRKTIHTAYQEYVKSVAPPDEKSMGYSTFRHFMKVQFPHVRFCRCELGASGSSNYSTAHHSKQPTSNPRSTSNSDQQDQGAVSNSDLASSPQLAAIPVILTSEVKQESGPAYIVTPLEHVLQTQLDLMSVPHTITVNPIFDGAQTFNVKTV